ADSSSDADCGAGLDAPGPVKEWRCPISAEVRAERPDLSKGEACPEVAGAITSTTLVYRLQAMRVFPPLLQSINS
ncbi:MAG: hypothetical protein ABFS45_25280, partial [Pseudomonadota bacterium]